MGIAFKCVFIGDGDLMSHVKKCIRQYRIQDSVMLTGAIDHEDYLRYIKKGHVLLLPSAYEGISVTLFESMALGLIPVVSRVGGHTEVVTEREGYLITPGANEVSEYVEVLKRLSNDPELRCMLSTAARKRILDKFTFEHGFAKFLAAIEQADKLSKTSPRQTPTEGLALELATQAIEYTRLKESISTESCLVRLLNQTRRFALGRILLDNWVSKLLADRIFKVTLKILKSN